MLKKVVVFDSGISGGMVGDMIEDEIPVEVIRVNDILHAPYSERTESEIRELTEQALQDYIGTVEAIVLAEPEVALAARNYLQRRYPEQKFVGYSWELKRIFGEAKRVRILTTRAVVRMARYQEMKANCDGIEISEGECTGWEGEIARYGTIDEAVEDEVIERTTEGFSGGLILVYTNNMMRMEGRLRKLFKWKATVVDMRKLLLRETCAALEYVGIDGNRVREVCGYK